MTKNRLDSMLQGEILKQIEEQQATIRQLKEAIYWALGERDDFPIRYPGDGAFYWRTELRKRSGLPVNGITDEPSSGRPVKPHRSGGGSPSPAFREDRLHRIDKLMDAQPGTPEGAELDKLVDEQVRAEEPTGELPPMRFKDWARDIRTQGLLAEIRSLKATHPRYSDEQSRD